MLTKATHVVADMENQLRAKAPNLFRARSGGRIRLHQRGDAHRPANDTKGMFRQAQQPPEDLGDQLGDAVYPSIDSAASSFANGISNVMQGFTEQAQNLADQFEPTVDAIASDINDRLQVTCVQADALAL